MPPQIVINHKVGLPSNSNKGPNRCGEIASVSPHRGDGPGKQDDTQPQLPHRDQLLGRSIHAGIVAGEALPPKLWEAEGAIFAVNFLMQDQAEL